MAEQHNDINRPVNPRRRKKTKFQIFKEAYLPVVIIGLALVLIVVFIVGSVKRSLANKRADEASSLAASSSLADIQAQLEKEAQELIKEAELLAADYDYQGAIAVLNTFRGDISKFTNINDKILAYEAAIRNLVAWVDPGEVVNLSFQLLIADTARSFSDATYGSAFNRNFITTEEFSKILHQLYENGYILVDLDDIISVETKEDGTTAYKAKTLYLPNGKKPLMLTQTNVNYNYYLIDSDGDRLPDAGGCGFASKLLWDGSKFTCEMVDATGQTVTGAFDMVPILENFIAEHPDFSYRGAKATLALTGYNGLLGYRTHYSASNTFGETAFQQDIKDVTTVINALRENGYTIACYTYENVAYGQYSATQIKADLDSWTKDVVPILGDVNILAYAQNSDITTDALYSGEKYEALQQQGFRYYLGFCKDGKPWATVTDDYVRQGRILVTGSNLAHHADWFASLFDPDTVLDTTRGNIPQ